MEFRQPASLNYLVSPDVPLNWETRRRIIGRLWPLILFSSLCMVETLTLKLIDAGRALTEGLPLLAVAFVFPFVMLMGALELSARVAASSPRWIRFDEKRIERSPAKRRRIRWENLKCVRVATVPSDAMLAKVTFEFQGAPRWPIILRKTDEISALASELKRRGVALVDEAPASAPDMAEAERRFRRTIGVSSLGLYLLVHGLPLLFVGISPPDKWREPGSAEHVAPAVKSFVRSFKSQESLRMFFVGSGLALSAAGFGLFFLGTRRLDRARA